MSAVRSAPFVPLLSAFLAFLTLAGLLFHLHHVIAVVRAPRMVEAGWGYLTGVGGYAITLVAALVLLGWGGFRVLREASLESGQSRQGPLLVVVGAVTGALLGGLAWYADHAGWPGTTMLSRNWYPALHPLRLAATVLLPGVTALATVLSISISNRSALG